MALKRFSEIAKDVALALLLLFLALSPLLKAYANLLDEPIQTQGDHDGKR